MNFFVIFLVTTNEVFGAENFASIDKEIEEKLLSRCKYKPSQTKQHSFHRLESQITCVAFLLIKVSPGTE